MPIALVVRLFRHCRFVRRAQLRRGIWVCLGLQVRTMYVLALVLALVILLALGLAAPLGSTYQPLVRREWFARGRSDRV